MLKNRPEVILCRPCEVVIMKYNQPSQQLIATEAISVETILKAVGIALGVFKYQLSSGNQAHIVTEARFITTFLIRSKLKHSHRKIAEVFRKDRTHIYYYLKKYDALSTYDRQFKTKVNRVNQKLKELTVCDLS